MDRRQEYSVRGGDDDRIHAADAPGDAELDPSPYSTRCGQAVLEVYTDGRAITCPMCGR
jgi:hypothetical protein